MALWKYFLPIGRNIRNFAPEKTQREKNVKNIRHIILLALITCCFSVYAQDTLTVQSNEPFYKKGIIGKVYDYFDDSNEVKPQKRFDFSIIGGPHYSNETKLGLGLVAAGIYRRNLADTVTMPSNISLYADFTSTGFYLLGIKGYHNFHNNRFRLNYKTYFYSFPNKFWGIGYENGRYDYNETSYRRKQMKFSAEFLVRIGKYILIGPSAQFCNIRGSKIDDYTLWQGQDMNINSISAGITTTFDSRDNTENAYKGTYVAVNQRFYVRGMGNDYAFSSTEITANQYCKVWKGGVLAMQFHSMLTYGNTPWTMLATVGGSESLRGYYEGRFSDKCEIDATVELRQHIWGRSGIVLWTGAGNVFPNFDSFEWSHTLPNFGFGYRWEFKNRINVRLDYGFGNHGESGFVFNINEAF